MAVIRSIARYEFFDDGTQGRRPKLSPRDIHTEEKTSEWGNRQVVIKNEHGALRGQEAREVRQFSGLPRAGALGEDRGFPRLDDSFQNLQRNFRRNGILWTNPR